MSPLTLRRNPTRALRGTTITPPPNYVNSSLTPPTDSGRFVSHSSSWWRCSSCFSHSVANVPASCASQSSWVSASEWVLAWRSSSWASGYSFVPTDSRNTATHRSRRRLASRRNVVEKRGPGDRPLATRRATPRVHRTRITRPHPHHPKPRSATRQRKLPADAES